MGRYITLGKRTFQSFSSDKCSTLAASIAYYAVFSIFPLAVFAVAVLGFILGGAQARQNVVDGVTKVIPLGDQGQQALAKTIKGATAAKGWLGLIGIFMAAWSASGLFGQIRSALDSVWDVDRDLPMLRANLRNLMLLIGFGGLIGLSVASTGFLEATRKAGSEVLGPLLTLGAPLFVLLTFLAPLLLTFAAFMVLYKLAPHARLGWGDVWPAALIAALFFEFGKSLLTFYIVHLGGFNALAGSLGAAILFLVFVYWTAQVILLAAEFAKHRMLVNSGAVPAEDPKVETPKISLTVKVKNMVEGLWVIEEEHHERDLPYHPGRLDPRTNEPTNTKEEVLYREQETVREARRESDKAGKAPQTVHAGSDQSATDGQVPAGALSRQLQDEMRREPVPTTSVAFGNVLQAGTAPGYSVHHDDVEASLWWKVAGFAVALVLSFFMKQRVEKQPRKAKASQQQKRPGGLLAKLKLTV
jgi:membrane protein